MSKDEAHSKNKTQLQEFYINFLYLTEIFIKFHINLNYKLTAEMQSIFINTYYKLTQCMLIFM